MLQTPRIAGSWLAFATVLASSSTLSADIIAQWTFETSQPSGGGLTIGPIYPEVGSGEAYGFRSGGSGWSSPVGNGSEESWRGGGFDGWPPGSYFEFQVSTVGYADLTLSWDQTRNETGQSVFDLSYSLNGADFTVLTDDYAVPAIAWNSGTPEVGSVFSALLAAVDDLENQPAVWFRLVAQGGGGWLGTVSVDNFTVAGVAAVPEAETSAAALLAGLGALGWHRHRRARQPRG